jgi:hypothetical protein
VIKPVWNTEAPPLPAGHMYRVRRKAFGYVTVELRKKRVFGSEQLSRVVLLPREHITAEAMIADGCYLALVEAATNIGSQHLLRAADKYVGDHLSQEDK